MTEPDERPGSDDPEDPSELMRLIGRTVPRSPHATGHVGAPGDEDPASASRHARSDPAEGENARTDEPPAAPADGALRSASHDHGAAPDEAGPSARGAVGESDSAESPEPDSGSGDPQPEDPQPGDPEPEDSAPQDPEPEDAAELLDDLTDDTELENALEALLLVVDSPVDEASLAGTLNQTPSRIRQTLNRMSLAYTADRRGIDLRRVGEGWRFYTRDRYAPYVEKLLLDGQRARLTRAALETLAVVAYRQPVTRARVSAVRGVNCDGVLRTLFTRGLVEEAGTEEQTGGTLFRTTELFLERLGLASVAELPPLAPLLPDIDAIDDLES